MGFSLEYYYKCPNKCFFLPFYGFICGNLEFPLVKYSKIFTAHRIQRDTNFKHENSRVSKGRVFDFCKFFPFATAQRNKRLPYGTILKQTIIKNRLPGQHLEEHIKQWCNYEWIFFVSRFTLVDAFHAHVSHFALCLIDLPVLQVT